MKHLLSICVLSLAALAAGCSGGDSVGPAPPPRPASIVIVSGPPAGAADTIDATLPTLLVLEVRDSSGAPIANTPVVLREDFSAVTLFFAPAGSDAFESFLQLSTGADGRASVRLRLGRAAEPTTLLATAGAASVRRVFQVLPGAPASLSVEPRDTVVFGSFVLRTELRDRIGNPLAKPAAESGTAAVRAISEGFLVSAPGGGQHEVVVRGGPFTTTARFLAVPAATFVAWDRLSASGGLTLFNIDGTGVRTMSDAGGTRHWDYAPSWAPDGSRVVFHSAYNASRLRTVDFETRYQDLTVHRHPGDQEFDPEFSRDGEWVYFVMSDFPDFWLSSSTIWRVRTSGGPQPPEQVGPSHHYRHDGAPSPSPDGTRVVFASDTAMGENPELRMLDLRTRVTQPLGIPGMAPRWSPAGDQIAYLDKHVLRVMAPDGSGRRTLAVGTRFENNLSWSPDGRWLIARTVEPGRVMVIHVESGRAVPLPFNSSAYWQPAWKP